MKAYLLNLFLLLMVSLSYPIMAQPVNDDCSGAIDLNPGNVAASGSLSGNTCSANNDYLLDCFSSTAPPDLVYSIEVPADSTLTISHSSDYNSKYQIAYGGACPGTTFISCDIHSGANIETFVNTTGMSQNKFL